MGHKMTLKDTQWDFPVSKQKAKRSVYICASFTPGINICVWIRKKHLTPGVTECWMLWDWKVEQPDQMWRRSANSAPSLGKTKFSLTKRDLKMNGLANLHIEIWSHCLQNQGYWYQLQCHCNAFHTKDCMSPYPDADHMFIPGVNGALVDFLNIVNYAIFTSIHLTAHSLPLHCLAVASCWWQNNIVHCSRDHTCMCVLMHVQTKQPTSKIAPCYC